ncbi:MAG: ATP-dependent DNA helicase [Aquificota bacterium]|nr:MAG: ATP-dependent DNA helicase [Aquificota bacterium]
MQIYEFLLKKGLERRHVQEKFFSIVLSAIEEGEGAVKIIEAPTGTGKTYGYLIPLIETSQKAIISTGTKLLQEQLRKDIETLRSYFHLLTGKEVKYLVIKGKGNYLCLDRYYELQPSERPANLELAVESQTWDGDFEFVEISQELREKLAIDEDHCTPHYRNLCPYKDRCYYYKRLKELERDADLLVVNHALLTLRDFEGIQERVLVIDEAHELDKYLVKSLSASLSLYTLRQEIMAKVREFLPSANADFEGFFVKNFEKLFKDGKEEFPLDSLAPYAKDFDEMVLLPLLSYYKTIRENLISQLYEFVSEKLFVSLSFKEYLLKSGLLNWEAYIELKGSYEEPSEEEQRWIKRIKNYELLSRKLAKVKDFARLMKEENAEYGFTVGRRWSKRLNTYNYYLSFFPLFSAGLIDFSGYKAVIVTSATVDPKDLLQTTGLQGEYYKLEHTFPYHKVNFLVYDADPRKREEWEDCLKRAYKYLRSLYDKVLILLTNKEHIKLFEREEGLAFQGEGALSSLVSQMREGSIKALAGLDSLWFGVDIKGHKGLLMAKLPFESPEDPLTYHRIRFLRDMGLDPFEYQKRKALIKFRQGVGRLMRSKEDAGTIILCDKRIFRFKEFLRAVQELGIKVKMVS